MRSGRTKAQLQAIPGGWEARLAVLKRANDAVRAKAARKKERELAAQQKAPTVAQV